MAKTVRFLYHVSLNGVEYSPGEIGTVTDDQAAVLFTAQRATDPASPTAPVTRPDPLPQYVEVTDLAEPTTPAYKAILTIVRANGGGGGGGGTGPAGRGIVSIARTTGTGAAGSLDTYTITYSDDSTSTFQVRNGTNGSNGTNGRGIDSVTRTAGTGAAGTVDTYTVAFSDATSSTFTVRNGADGAKGADGRSVTGVARTGGNGAAGTTDTYTITYSDATTSTFTVRHGTDGAKGDKGDVGPAGPAGGAPAELRRALQAVAAQEYAPARIVGLGSSTMEGHGASTAARRFMRLFADQLRSRRGGEFHPAARVNSFPGYPVALSGGASISATTGESSGWAGRTAVLRDADDAITYTPPADATGFQIIYGQYSGGPTITYSIDGAAAVTINTGSPATTDRFKQSAVIPLTPGTAHTVVVNRTGALGALAYVRGFEYFVGDETNGVHVYDGGHAGWTTTDYVTNEPQWGPAITTLQPDLVIMQIGPNNFTAGISAAQTQTDLTALVTAVNARMTTPTTYLFTLPSAAGSAAPDQTAYAAYVTAIKAACTAAGGYLVDVRPFLPSPGQPGSLFGPDNTHMTDAGHALFGELVAVPLVSAKPVLALTPGGTGGAGSKGDPGPAGRGITGVVRTAGDGSAGSVDTYTITYSDTTTSSFQVRNGTNGTNGSGGAAQVLPAHVPATVTGRYDLATSLYNVKQTNTRRLRVALGKAGGTDYFPAPQNYQELWLGDSIVGGCTGLSAGAGGTDRFDRVNTVVEFHKQALAQRTGVAPNGTGLTRAHDGTRWDDRFVLNATASAANTGSGGTVTMTPGGTVTFTSNKAGDSARVTWYDNFGSTVTGISVSVNGATSGAGYVAIKGSSSNKWKSTLLTGLTIAVGDTVTITGVTGSVIFGMVEVFSSLGGIVSHNGSNSGSTLKDFINGGGYAAHRVVHDAGMLPFEYDVVHIAFGLFDATQQFSSAGNYDASSFQSLLVSTRALFPTSDFVLHAMPVPGMLRDTPNSWTNYITAYFNAADILDCPVVDVQGLLGGYYAEADLGLTGDTTAHLLPHAYNMWAQATAQLAL